MAGLLPFVKVVDNFDAQYEVIRNEIQFGATSLRRGKLQRSPCRGTGEFDLRVFKSFFRFAPTFVSTIRKPCH